MSAAAALELRAVTKRFGETLALDGATCVVRSGSVHAVLGENGAGKTTLMKIAFGLLQADAGDIEIEGRPVHFASSRDAIAAGLGMVHQHFMLVPAFTVAENVALGGRGLLHPEEAAARVREVAESTGLAVDPTARVADLPIGAQQRAELVRALAQKARLLILDEPTAVLTPSETEELYRWMRRFAESGGSVVLVTHKLREALAVADDVTVLRRGRTVLAGPAPSISEAQLVEAIVGADAPATGAPLDAAAADAAVVFSLNAASVVDAQGVTRLHATTLDVRRGEILGVLGVEGSGQAELLRLLAGRLAASQGTVRAPTRVGFIPADRLQEAVIPEMSVTENLTLAEAGTLQGRVDWRARGAQASEIVATQEVRTAGVQVPMRALSGGNQQKFVVGRETRLAATAIVAENPTRGLDVRAAARVLETIRQVAASGDGAAVVYSTDLDEVLSLTRRVIVCFAGRVTEVVPPDDASDRSAYARAMLGAAT